MKTQLHRVRIFRAEALLHNSGPHAPGRAEFRDLFEKIIVHVEEEAQTFREVVDVQPAIDRGLYEVIPLAKVKATSAPRSNRPREYGNRKLKSAISLGNGTY